MTLAQIKSLVDSKTYYSRGDTEVWAAINTAAWRMYTKVRKENKGYFIKTDISSVRLKKDTKEYLLPDDCDQIVRLRERQLGQTEWNKINPAESMNTAAMYHDTSIYPQADTDAISDFSYYGPFQAEDESEDESYVSKISISPIPQDTRQVELIYTAKFVEITDEKSPLVIPHDGHHALIDLAVAELLTPNGDALASTYLATGDQKREEFLTEVRDRQIQQLPTVTPYLDDTL